MDELKGLHLQIILHVKEGLGFGFLRNPFIVTGSLSGYKLDTDPVVPSHTPTFDAELVWEADKRRFRSLRVQNVPIKVEVFALGTQSRKDRVGYILLSLLGGQPCPSNTVNDLKYTWHKLLGVKSEGKCCHPQLLMSLSIEDRVTILTPRNDIRMFHNNEVADASNCDKTNFDAEKSASLTMDEFMQDVQKANSCPELKPRLLPDKGLLQIGDGEDLFVISLVLGTIENFDAIFPESSKNKKGRCDCYIAYSVFNNDIMTNRVPIGEGRVTFNQKTSLRLRSSLASLTKYFALCPKLLVRVCASNKDIGIFSVNLRKLVPTVDMQQFLDEFTNGDNSLTVAERSFLAPTEGRSPRGVHVDLQVTLKYLGRLENVQPTLTARSATQLKRSDNERPELECRATSCAVLSPGSDARSAGVNKARYKNASGDNTQQTNELTEMLRKMFDSFTSSQERMFAARFKPMTGDMQVQCEPERDGDTEKPLDRGDEGDGGKIEAAEHEPVRLEKSKSDSCMQGPEQALLKKSLTPRERDEIMRRMVEELEDWKEKQQDLYKCQLKLKEDYHLNALSAEWVKKRSEMEAKLHRGIEQCRKLAAGLSRATDDFRRRGRGDLEKDKQLIEAAKVLEAEYSGRFAKLKDASRLMEENLKSRLKLKDTMVEELQGKVRSLDKQVDRMKEELKDFTNDKDRSSGLTKGQTASLIQELRCLEEKLNNAVESKTFFKEQWSRAVRELHVSKMRERHAALQQLRHERRLLDPELEQDDEDVDFNKLKDDTYMLTKTTTLESPTGIRAVFPEGVDVYGILDAAKRPANDKLNELIVQREALIREESPDEGLLQQLNQDIRNMLINCGT